MILAFGTVTWEKAGGSKMLLVNTGGDKRKNLYLFFFLFDFSYLNFFRKTPKND
jgi:hypothetical protein